MILKNLYQNVGNSNGSYKFKDNRAQKLIDKWDDLRVKFEDIAQRGNLMTEHARCALAILCIMDTGIRVGNESSAEGYVCNQKHHKDYGKVIQTYGLTTLQINHCQLNNKLIISFLGKKAVNNKLVTKSPTLINYYKFRRTTPGVKSDHRLFFIDYYQLFSFVKKYIGKQYTPKDIRTAVVNLKFIKNIENIQIDNINIDNMGKSIIKKIINEAIKKTAEQVGHTTSVCKRSYLSIRLLEQLEQLGDKRRR